MFWCFPKILTVRGLPNFNTAAEQFASYFNAKPKTVPQPNTNG